MENLINACPWTDWEPSTLQWCEERLCAWIREPSNTWSNLTYVIIGATIIYLARAEQNRHLRLLGIFSILIGLMSGFYHASGTFAGEVLDFSSMFLLSTFFVVVNGARIGHWSYRHLKPIAFGIVTVSVILLILFKTVGTALFALQFNLALWFEYKIYKSQTVKINYKPLLYNLGLFTLAYGIWWLDKSEIVCDPQNHILSGHAAWHILTGTSIIFLYFYYKQFALAKDHVSSHGASDA